MKIIKKIIPLWIKCPVVIFLGEVGKMPLQLVWGHVYRSFVENSKCSVETKNKAYTAVKRATYKYLSKRYNGLVRQFVSQQNRGVKQEHCPIWVFWWQGEENAPEIVKHCIASIRRNAGAYCVQIIDAHNYNEFVDIPEHINCKLRTNAISLTHFSDFYRMALLAEHGGLWIDASIFVKLKIDDELLEKSIFTIRNPGMDTTNISNWNWTVGIIGGWKGNTLFLAVRELLSTYWKEHNFLIDYFLFDYMVKLVYDNCSVIKEEIMSVAPNNSHFYYLQNYANHPFDEALYEKEMCSATWLYKISWKGEYSLKTMDGKETFYSKWLKDSDFTGVKEKKNEKGKYYCSGI